MRRVSSSKCGDIARTAVSTPMPGGDFRQVVELAQIAFDLVATRGREDVFHNADGRSPIVELFLQLAIGSQAASAAADNDHALAPPIRCGRQSAAQSRDTSGSTKAKMRLVKIKQLHAPIDASGIVKMMVARSRMVSRLVRHMIRSSGRGPQLQAAIQTLGLQTQEHRRGVAKRQANLGWFGPAPGVANPDHDRALPLNRPVRWQPHRRARELPWWASRVSYRGRATESTNDRVSAMSKRSRLDGPVD